MVVGVSEMGDIASLSRIGWRTLAWTIVLSGIAVLLGLVLVNIFKPGAGVDPTRAALLAEGRSEQRSCATARPTGLEMRSRSCRRTSSRGIRQRQHVALMFFALMFGVARVLTRSPQTDILKRGTRACSRSR